MCYITNKIYCILTVMFLCTFLQEIPPYETKHVMNASFIGREENNHTAFIRIKTSRDNLSEVLTLPVEVEVTAC